MTRRKICFFLLNYKADTHRHYYHIYEFIESLGERVDLRLLIKDVKGEPRFSNVTDIIDLTGQGLRASVRRMAAILKARWDGYSCFYHHYTTGPARFSALINRITGGKTYLWHCIVMDALDKDIRGKNLKRWLLKSTLHIVHHLVTGSSRMADYYSALYGIDKRKILVVPNYINLSRFDYKKFPMEKSRKTLGIPEDKKVILYLHEIEEGRARNLPGIITSVLSDRSDVMFLIAGDGRYRNTLEREVQKYVASGAVRFEGSIPNIQAPVYYSAADVFIMTSDFEAFSRVLLEAMAMKTPYVATDGGGMIRAVTPPEHQDFLLSSEQITLFPKKICELLDHPDIALQLAETGFRWVQRYSLDESLKTFLESVR